MGSGGTVPADWAKMKHIVFTAVAVTGALWMVVFNLGGGDPRWQDAIFGGDDAVFDFDGKNWEGTGERLLDAPKVKHDPGGVCKQLESAKALAGLSHVPGLSVPVFYWNP